MSNVKVIHNVHRLNRHDLSRNVEHHGCFEVAFRSVTSSKYFKISTTLVLGLGLYVADIISDIFVGFSYFLKRDLWWGYLSLGLIFIPGMLRGIYELTRQPIAYQNETKTFKLMRNYGRFRQLHFGLDVFPKAYLKLPKSRIIRLICAPLYILSMGIWFPFLPIIQFLRVVEMQLAIQENSHDNEIEKLNIEEHRAISIKSVETFLESAPQLFLQIYVSYQTELGTINWWSVMSMIFSFLAIVKTSIDLQEVDRFLKAIGNPSSYFIYLVTSIFWFTTTVLFRTLAISILCFYAIHMKFNWIIMGIGMAILIFLNVGIRSLFTKSCRLLHGTMSVIAPVHMIIIRKNHFTEKLTKSFLGCYVAINTAFHFASLAIIYSIRTHDIFLVAEWIRQEDLFAHLFPGSVIVGLLSVLSSWFHWKWGLLELFRVECKYPNFEDKRKRIRSYPKNWRVRQDHSPKNLAALGLFYGQDPSGSYLCCYDCGIKIRGHDDEIAPDVLHGARLLQYKITYFKDTDTIQNNSPDEIRGAFNRANYVKPTCRVLERNGVDFKDPKIRLQTFKMHWVDQLPHGVRPYALAQAGFVATMGMTAVCYDCYTLVDWTNAWARFNTPWGLHAQHKRSSTCHFLQQSLSVEAIRLETFPNVWRLSKEDRLKKQCDHLAQAGFFCQMWRNGQAWMKCCNCPAYVYHMPFFAPLKSNVKSIAPKEGELEMAGPNYHPFDANTDFAYWTWIIHYAQSIDCPYIQDHYRSSKARLQSFPANWNANVSAETVANAGFIYFPLSSYTGAGNFKEIQDKPTTKTKCPKCLLEVDWNHETLPPDEIIHCSNVPSMHQELLSTVKRSSSTKE